MALSVVVFDVGETLVDEANAEARWEPEDAASFVFSPEALARA
jgi:FMN phosphatase YigB (HAD superfamily)